MAKTLNGIVVSTAMTNIVVVEVTRRTPHPLYQKLMKRSKKYKVVKNGMDVVVGQRVNIQETRPVSKDTHFKLLSIEETQQKKAAKKAPVKKVAETKEKKS